MLEACRTCLGLINVNNSLFYEIETDDMLLSADSCRYKLLSVVPEMTLNIGPKSMLCVECHKSLEALFEFKEKCLKTEKIIEHYFQTKPGLDIKKFDLRDVSAFKAADIEIIEDEFIKVLVKEDVEQFGGAFLNHELDDLSLESVEVAPLKSVVPDLSADIEISGDKAVELSFEEVAIKEELELYDTVITDVKHEVDDFSSESIEVDRSKNAGPGSLADIKITEDKAVDASFEEVFVKEEVELKNAKLGSNFICEYCEKQCKNIFSLKIHLRKHTGEKPHRCEICSRRFGQKHHLTVHMRTHTGEQPYACTVCHKGFPLNSALTVHMRSHTGEEPYRCEKCDRSFTRKSHLTSHLRFHTGEWPYFCTVCNKGFCTTYKLVQHMRSHTGEKPYRCEICSRPFGQKHHLTLHMRIHAREQPYVHTDELEKRMGLTERKKSRHYGEKLKTDQEKLAELRKKRRESYHRNKVLISSISPEDQESCRLIWKLQKQSQRSRQKARNIMKNTSLSSSSAGNKSRKSTSTDDTTS